ncbi:MAG: hypothetical protein IJ565_01030 [Bacilli bacterium]|nr:hypothetical protein [Bacilli bacterium]
MSKYVYLKYHFKKGYDKSYSINNYYKWYTHNRPMGNKNKPEKDEYLLTYKQFHKLLRDSYLAAKEELLKGNEIKITKIGTIRSYTCVSKPKLDEKGNIKKGWKPLDWYYRPYAYIYWVKATANFKYKSVFKFFSDRTLRKQTNDKIRAGEIFLPNIEESEKIYKLYRNGRNI